MSVRILIFCCFFILSASSCSTVKKVSDDASATKPSAKKTPGTESMPSTRNSTATKAKTFIKPLKIDRAEFVGYAKTFLGTPYKYGSAIPQNGFDCSGFISHVFSHFNVKAPRTSVDFTNEGTEIDIANAKPGDIILFTGSDNSTVIVGHMGIITSGGSLPQFIHSASGKNIGVILNNFTGYYKTHFVKVIRILE